jgi:hypothetical protein
MPQPIKTDGLSWSNSSAYIFEKCPDCVAGIGYVGISWTQVEAALFALVSGALGPANESLDGSWGLSTNWIAKSAMVEAETIRVRIKIAESTYGTLIKGSPIQGKWDSIVKDLNKRSSERNAIVHGAYGWSETYPDGLLRIEKDGLVKLWKMQDFNNTANRMHILYGELHHLLLDTLKAIKNKEIKNGITSQIEALAKGLATS